MLANRDNARRTLITLIPLLLLISNHAFATPPAPAPATTPATETTPTPAATVSEKPLAGMQDIAVLIPQEFVPPTMAGWTDIKISAVNDVLREKVKGHLARFTFKIDSDAVKMLPGDDKSAFVIFAPQEIIGKQTFLLTCRCPDAMKTQLASLNAGDTITVLARIADLRLERRDATKVPLVVDGADVTIESVLRAGAASRPAIAATTPASRPAAFNLQSLTALIPDEVAPPRGGSWTVAKAQAAEDAMARALTKPARLTLKVGAVQKNGDNWTVVSTTLTDRENAATADITLNVTDTRLAALISENQTILVEGNISSITVQLGGTQNDRQMVNMRFAIDVTAIPAGAPVPANRGPAPPPPPPAGNAPRAPRPPNMSPPAKQRQTFNF